MFAVVDIEATGGSPANARIMEIAIVIHDGKKIIDEYSTLVNPERKIDKFVVQLTGITDNMVSTAPTFKEVAQEILDITEGKTFVAHNAQFDYGFLRNEYRRLNITFQRKTLCTVKMSQKLLPEHNSYSLGKLCKALDIPIKDRHRALGDAEATAVLLEKLLYSDKKELVEEMLKGELATAVLPPNMAAKEIDELPEELGVYYFRDENGEPLYIAKSRNIRKRVLQHFSVDLASAKYRTLKDKVHSIDCVFTGNELIAELLVSRELKRYKPEFNKTQKRKTYRYGLFVYTDDNGYNHLKSRILNSKDKPALKFVNKRWAEKALLQMRKKHHLNQETREQLSPVAYNEKLQHAIDTFLFPSANCLIIGEGRNYFEQSVVQITEGRYVGYGYFSTEEVQIESPQDLIEFVKQDENNPYKEQIVRKYLKQKKNFKLIPY